MKKTTAQLALDALKEFVCAINYQGEHAGDRIDIAEREANKAITALEAEAAQVVEPDQWQKRHTKETAGIWENTYEADAKWWRDNSKGWEIRSLYTAPQEPAAPAWMPIETAPTDGTHILVCRATDADGNPIGDSFGLFVQRAAWWEGEGWICYCSTVHEPIVFFDPTHWMPIPPAPGGAS